MLTAFQETCVRFATENTRLLSFMTSRVIVLFELSLLFVAFGD